MDQLHVLVFHEHPHISFLASSFCLSVLSISPEPALIPSVLLLTVSLLYASKILPGRHSIVHSLILWTTLTVGSCLAWFSASVNAVSSNTEAIFALMISLAVTSFVPLTTIFFYTRLRTRVSFDNPLLFPTIWASVWCAFSHVSPTGYLGLWTPVSGTGPYRWGIQHLLGPVFLDWVTAAWALVLSRTIELSYMDSRPAEEEPLLGDHFHSSQSAREDRQGKATGGKGILFLGVSLAALALPSFVVSGVSDISVVIGQERTPLSVGCILPSMRQYKHYNPTLDDFIAETQKMRPLAHVLLWPEGAVSFKNSAERDKAFQEIRTKAPGPLIGVSYEESYEEGGRTHKRTAMALISSISETPLLVYHKRHLVPLVESFPLTPSSLPPTIYEYPLRPPKDVKKPEWAPAPNYTRPISITSSICLDMAMPSPFRELDARPALILAPARTWDRSIGQTMWKQAQTRAEELGSIVLWCDGGAGGVSGVSSGPGKGGIERTGEGSWVREIGIEYPFPERRTVYAKYGDELGLGILWLIAFAGMMGRRIKITGNVGLLKEVLQSTHRKYIAWRERPEGNTNLLE